MNTDCLHCGRHGENVYRTPASRVSKRDNSMSPLGWYYWVFCDRCDTLPSREYSPLWKVHPDRLVHSAECYQDHDEAFRNLFSGAKPPG